MIGDGERVCGAFGVTVPLPLHEKARDHNLRDREEEKQCQGEGRPSLDDAANQSKAEDRQNQKQPQKEALQRREFGLPQVKGKKQLQDNRMD